MDLILSQYNLDSPLPTFFEMRAQEELMPILSSGFRYALTVTAQRVIPLSKVVPYSDELFAVLWGLLDYKFLSAIDSTFSENFYGLKRVVAPRGVDVMKDVEQEGLRSYLRLSKRDHIISVLLSVLIPYIKTRLQDYMTRCKEEQGTSAEESLTPRWRTIRKAFVRVYPWLHFAMESITVVYWIRYLFEAPWWSAGLHSRRIVLRRLERQDYMELQSSPHMALLERTGNVLLWGIVCFRVMEWWNSTEAARQEGGGGGGGDALGDQPSVRVPPPAPPAEVQGLDGAAQCPLCRHSVTNPTLNASTGLVYCYPCIHQHVEHYSEDPVTHTLTTLDHLRRIYETSA
eukprot:TRINITY_DN30942_c0_g1_i1.p1 TRINITY_DN30942_c0_g1~~TRINITY_DN30942_c0_g1_i1.p1  ORF type:complete len:344 (+),score=89.33 TRINITY_DN30942_c0_g1_i1:396-1427(+)